MAPNQDNGPTEDTNNDQSAWLKAAAARSYGIRNGEVVDGAAGELWTLRPLPGFGSLPETVQPLVFHAVAQFTKYRVAQNVDGMDVQGTINSVLVGGNLPSTKSNDALEDAYVDYVTSLVNGKLGELPENASKEDKAKRASMIADSAAMPANREKHYETAVNAALEAGRTARAAKERKRAKAAPKAGLDLTA